MRSFPFRRAAPPALQSGRAPCPSDRKRPASVPAVGHMAALRTRWPTLSGDWQSLHNQTTSAPISPTVFLLGSVRAVFAWVVATLFEREFAQATHLENTATRF